MPAHKRVKNRAVGSRLVAVIASASDLRAAPKLLPRPDLFEIRLDCIGTQRNLDRKIRTLTAPLIITARHPAEGGRNNLSAAARRDLLLRFMPVARYVDIELRSVRTSRTVLDRARRLGVDTIMSFHDLETTPSLTSLRAKARQARRLRPAVLKVATRTDDPTAFGRLLQFASLPDLQVPLAVMGIGRLGTVSRLLSVQCGSILAYTSVHEPQIAGQLSLKDFRAALRHIEIDS